MKILQIAWFVAESLLLSQFCHLTLAQCTPRWLSIPGMPVDNGFVNALQVWDPDGAGPQTEVVVVAGRFTISGNGAARNIAAFDPSSGEWQPLGAGFSQDGRALAVMPNGDLVAAVDPAWDCCNEHNCIYRWSIETQSWAPMGPGMLKGSYTLQVNALLVQPNGDLIAGGMFSKAGGASVHNIARWDGSMWSALDSGVDEAVFSLAAMHNGDLVVGGKFANAGGVSANGIARWNPETGWSSFGAGLTHSFGFTGAAEALRVLANGDLVAGGYFHEAGGVPATYIARWNGSTWFELNGGTTLPVSALTTLRNGNLVVGGDFIYAGGAPASHLALWNGESWSTLGTGVDGLVRALTTLSNGDVVAAGYFGQAGGIASPRIAQYAFASQCCSGDFNSDSFVDDSDFQLFVAAYNVLVCEDPAMAIGCPCDMNSDGFVDDADFVRFVVAYNELLCP